MTNIDETMRESDFHKRSKGLNEMKVADRLQEFGPNFIKISVPPILYLVFHEVNIPSTIVHQSVKRILKLNDFGSDASNFASKLKDFPAMINYSLNIVLPLWSNFCPKRQKIYLSLF